MSQTAEYFPLKTNDGKELHGHLWSIPAPRAAIALVHGLGEHAARYGHVAEALNNAGYAVIAFDLRGHGRSTASAKGTRGHGESYERMMDDISSLLHEATERFPACPQILYGHSMGGNLVLNFALRRKPALAGVIATSSALRPAFTPPALKLAAGRLLYSLVPSLTLPNGLDATGISHNPDVVAAYLADPLRHDRLSAQLGMDVLTSGEWALQNAAEWTLPLLLMHGEADRLTSCTATKEFAKNVPSALLTLRTWAEGYHELHNEPNNAEVLEYICQWVQTVLDSK